MENPIHDPFSNLIDRILLYLPNLLAGLLLMAFGTLLGWFIKRVVVQLCIIFRPDRLLQRFRWGKAFLKADVRRGLFEFLGNIAFLIIFLIFLNNAVSVMQITVLSKLLEMGIFFLPRVLSFVLILGCGWLVSTWTSGAMVRALLKEEIPRATLIARFAKTVLLLFFSAMALLELGIAREIVIIGFTTMIITLGFITIVLTAIGGKSFVNRIMETLEGD